MTEAKKNFKPSNKPVLYQVQETFVVSSNFKQEFSANDFISTLNRMRTQKEDMLEGIKKIDREIDMMLPFEKNAKEIHDKDMEEAKKYAKKS